MTVGNVADVIVGLGLVGEDIAAVGVLSGLDEVVDVDRAAGLGGWVEGLGWTAALFSIGRRENSVGRYVAADLVGWVEGSGSAAAQASSGVRRTGTASLGGRVESGGSAALESVGDALNSSATAVLGAGGEGSVTAAGLSNSASNHGVGAANVGGGVDDSVAAALGESVGDGNDGAGAANLGSWVGESVGAAAGGGKVNSAIIDGGHSSDGVTTFLGSSQEFVSTANALEVAASDWDWEDGVDTANLGGSVVSVARTTTSESLAFVLVDNPEC